MNLSVQFVAELGAGRFQPQHQAGLTVQKRLVCDPSQILDRILASAHGATVPGRRRRAAGPHPGPTVKGADLGAQRLGRVNGSFRLRPRNRLGNRARARNHQERDQP